jgi:hypothetical protein
LYIWYRISWFTQTLGSIFSPHIIYFFKALNHICLSKMSVKYACQNVCRIKLISSRCLTLSLYIRYNTAAHVANSPLYIYWMYIQVITCE